MQRTAQLVKRDAKGFEHFKESVKLGYIPKLVAAWNSTQNVVVWEKEDQ